jgi:hypothetical protein
MPEREFSSRNPEKEIFQRFRIYLYFFSKDYYEGNIQG